MVDAEPQDEDGHERDLGAGKPSDTSGSSAQCAHFDRAISQAGEHAEALTASASPAKAR